MTRLLVLLALCCAPLMAVAPDPDSALALESADVDVTLDARHAATVKISLVVRNPGEAADFALHLSDDAVPAAQHKTFTLAVNGAATAPTHVKARFDWTIRIEGTAKLEWTTSGGSTRLPHLHPLGKRELIVRLAHLRGYASLPEIVPVHVHHAGLPAELFGRSDGTEFTLEQPAGARVQDLTLSWLDSTLADKRAGLRKTLDSFKDSQPGADNRLYTNTLAHLVDLELLSGDNDSAAGLCETLARLETDTGKALSLCGPAAEWRRYVPWQLLRLRALEAAGKDAKDAAKLSVAMMTERWPAYVKAKAAARPFDEFDARFGNYWDYDWKTTRELYARALELTGDKDGAAAVKKVED